MCKEAKKVNQGGIRDWKTLRKVAGDGLSDAILCLSTIEVLKRMNHDSILRPLVEAGAGFTAHLLRDGALFRAHILVVRAYAPVSRKDDLHLRAAIDFLNSSDGISSLKSGAMKDRMNCAVRRFGSMQDDKRLQQMKNMRDKLLAHWAKPIPRRTKTTYANFFNVVKGTARIWEDLAAARRGVPVIDVREAVQDHADSADAFWRLWERHGAKPTSAAA